MPFCWSNPSLSVKLKLEGIMKTHSQHDDCRLTAFKRIGGTLSQDWRYISNVIMAFLISRWHMISKKCQELIWLWSDEISICKLYMSNRLTKFILILIQLENQECFYLIVVVYINSFRIDKAVTGSDICFPKLSLFCKLQYKILDMCKEFHWIMTIFFFLNTKVNNSIKRPGAICTKIRKLS